MLAEIIGPIVKAILDAFLGVWERRKTAQDLANAMQRAGAAEAANETQQVIADVADQRANLPAEPDTPDALAARLRDKARRRTAGGGSPDDRA